MKKSGFFTMLLSVSFFIFSIFIASVPAYTAIIVDTGTGSSQFDLSNYQWLSAQFTIDQPYELTDIEGYFGTYRFGTGIVTLAIYDDSSGGELPDINNERFSDTFSWPTSGPVWSGLNGISWSLPAGTYWVSFEVRDDEETGYVAIRYNVSNPLSNYARTISAGDWLADDSANIGVKILGNPVPVPGALWLLGSGLIGIVGIRRKFKS